MFSPIVDEVLRKAVDMSAAVFLPSSEDIRSMQERMAILVERILVDNVPAFNKVCFQEIYIL